jgi:hypothetical protein
MIAKRAFFLAATGAAMAAADPAWAEGPTLEIAAAGAEIDIAPVDYGLFQSVGGPRSPLVAQDNRQTGQRFDARVANLAWAPFGWDGETYVRVSYQRAESEFNAAYPKAISDLAVVPTGVADTFTTLSFWALAATGSGTIAAARELEQREAELAGGVVLNRPLAGFQPRIELGYRRGQIDQTLTADRVGVTPLLEEYTTQSLDLTSDCADLSVGAARRFALAQRWALVADAALGVGYCRHDLEGTFEVTGFAPWPHDDRSNNFTTRGAFSLGLERRLAPSLALGLNAFARAESHAPYVAFPAWNFGAFGEVIGVDGEVRVDTESRSSYGAALTLRWTPD